MPSKRPLSPCRVTRQPASRSAPPPAAGDGGACPGHSLRSAGAVPRNHRLLAEVSPPRRASSARARCWQWQDHVQAWGGLRWGHTAGLVLGHHLRGPWGLESCSAASSPTASSWGQGTLKPGSLSQTGQGSRSASLDFRVANRSQRASVQHVEGPFPRPQHPNL